MHLGRHFQRRGRGLRRRGTVAALRNRLVVVLGIVGLVVGLAGCDFSPQDRDQAAGQFSANDEEFGFPTTPPQSIPQEGPSPSPPPPGPCVDPDPAVIATCLASTGGLMPGDEQGEVTVVAERTTGKIITTKRYGPARTIATFPVDGSGDGGLIDFALSPTFDQDQLIYALISTPSDNRVVRLAPGDVAKPILTGIPKGANGNMGSLLFASPTDLVVATGNAGNPAAANDPSSLAGKLLVVSDLSSGGNARPKVLASGFGSNVSLCPDTSGSGTLYVADQGPTEDRLQAVDESGTATVLWTWPDKPQIAGCAATTGQIFVSETRTQRIEAITAPTRQNPTVNPPTVVLEKRYGALGRMTALENGVLQFATVNRAYGQPVSTDDRVVRFIAPPAGENRT